MLFILPVELCCLYCWSRCVVYIVGRGYVVYIAGRNVLFTLLVEVCCLHCWYKRVVYIGTKGTVLVQDLVGIWVLVCVIFLKLVVWVFQRAFRFPPLLHRFLVSANKMKLKTNTISTPSKIFAELSIRTRGTRHVARDNRPMLLVICTRLRHGHLSVRVGAVRGAVRRL